MANISIKMPFKYLYFTCIAYINCLSTFFISMLYIYNLKKLLLSKRNYYDNKLLIINNNKDSLLIILLIINIFLFFFYNIYSSRYSLIFRVI